MNDNDCGYDYVIVVGLSIEMFFVLCFFLVFKINILPNISSFKNTLESIKKSSSLLFVFILFVFLIVFFHCFAKLRDSLI